MYTNPLPYSNYTYYANSVSVPSISLDMNNVSISDMLTVIDSYLDFDTDSGTAVDYMNEVSRRIYKRDYVRDRFHKDLLGMNVFVDREPNSFSGSLSKIDLVHNEYIANEKSNELFDESARDASLQYDTGIQNTINNYARLFSTIMVKDDCSGLIYENYELPVIYDTRAIIVKNQMLTGHDQYVLSTDTVVNSEKEYFLRNGQIYSEVQDPEGNPSEQGWYELTENVVVFIMENPAAENNNRIYNSFDLAFKLTQDESAKSSKKYYSLSGSQFVEASVEASDDLTQDDFYEIDLTPSSNKKKYTLRYNSNSEVPHWYVSTISENDDATTIGAEIIVTPSIDSDEIEWQNASV